MEDNKITVLEWNVRSVSCREEKRINDIVNKIFELKADVVVLTEVTFAYQKISKLLLVNDDYFVVGTNNAGNANNIVIAISIKKIEKVFFDDLYSYKTGENIEIERSCEQNYHPDRLLAHIKLKEEYGGSWLKIMGIRMQCLLKNELEKQFNAFKWEIENYTPDIVIGDFNWYSAIQEIQKDGSFKEIYLVEERSKKRGRKSQWKNKYKIWPDDTTNVISYVFRGKDGVVTAPDRVMWKESSIIAKPSYYNNLRIGDRFPEGWERLSDHDILIFEMEIR